ncbi:MAG: type II toxin-antitoxin system RelB/DinJ family antitoxin [Bacilli bacterium]|nr:type II toxin-antitoxin system RelB/DinJ family antitoxin [Bacilli bacterium]
MANITTLISVQIDKEDKERASEILQKLGVSMSGLINMTIKQLIMRGKIPFEVAIPKEEYDLYHYFTKDELEETAKELIYMEKHPEEYKSYDNIEELKEALLSDD